MTSVPPPGANGTTIRTGFVGKVCADAVPAETQPIVAVTAHSQKNLSILMPKPRQKLEKVLQIFNTGARTVLPSL
ncbi:hypothetical protein D3C83_85610 [compost metagenome]